MERFDFDTSEVITLAEFKKQMNVDHDEDNDYITALGKAAASAIVHRTRRTVGELKVLGGGTYPEELKLATMMLAAHWYRVREAVSTASQNAVPYSLEYLVRPYTRLGGTRKCCCHD